MDFRRGLAVNGHIGVVDLFEKTHPPDKMFVIGVTPSLNQELKAYASESFFLTKASWLEEISSARGVVIYDGVLTLPDGDRVRPVPSTYSDPAYSRELDRRWRIVRGEAFSAEKLP